MSTIKARKRKLSRSTSIAIALFFIVSIIISANIIVGITKDNNEEVITLISDNIAGDIDYITDEMIIIAQQGASNSDFIAAIVGEYQDGDSTDSDFAIQKTLAQLETLEGVDTAYVVVDSSKLYFTSEGIFKTVSEEDELDQWYYDFRASGNANEIKVDRDDKNTNQWMVYVNIRLKDELGNFVGVFGLGMKSEKLMDFIAEVEQKHNVGVTVVNQQGEVQFGDDSLVFAKGLFSDEYADLSTMEETLKRDNRGLGQIHCRYIQSTGWYMILEKDNDALTKSIITLVVQYVLAALILLALLLVVTRLIVSTQQSGLEKDASIDTLTGIPNRRYVENVVKKSNVRKKYKAVAMVDIDKFKDFNDTKGHLAGDEILKRVARHLMETVGENGDVIRWGGDEFLIMFLVEEGIAYDICEGIRTKIENDITLSIGLCQSCGVGDIEREIDKADRALYLAKTSGRNQTQKYI